MSTTVADPITDAVARAQAAASAHVAAQAANLPVVPSAQTGTAVAPVRPGRPLTMDDMAAGSIQVDQWIGVKEHGFIIGADKQLHTEELIVDIDLAAVAPHKAIKFGNPATYLKSYDGITCAQGGTWEQAIARAQRVDQNAREYSSCDLPMVLTHQVKKGSKVLAEQGDKLGYSLSTTNWNTWRTFWTDCTAKGLAGQTVRVKLGYERRTNKAGNVWGIMTFTLAA